MASVAPFLSPSSLSGIRRGGSMDLCEASHLSPLAGQLGLRYSGLSIPRRVLSPWVFSSSFFLSVEFTSFFWSRMTSFYCSWNESMERRHCAVFSGFIAFYMGPHGFFFVFLRWVVIRIILNSLFLEFRTVFTANMASFHVYLIEGNTRKWFWSISCWIYDVIYGQDGSFLVLEMDQRNNNLELLSFLNLLLCLWQI